MTSLLRLCITCIAVVSAFVLGHPGAADAAGKKIKAPSLDTLRCSDGYLLGMLEQGLSRSATLRDIRSHLEHASVIVYLSRGVLQTGLAGRTRIMGAGENGWRYLAVELDNRGGPIDLLSVLAHELQHVLEIADAPEVVDAESLARFYRRIGIETIEPGRRAESFETQLALDMGHRVHHELQGWVG